MDYAAVYQRFIADRLARQPERPAYFERHHIVPRAKGGTEDPENIIRLTPEDHFFAHILLAKIHGGRMWAPLAFMIGQDRYGRREYGHIRRQLSAALSGEGAHQFDHTHRELMHVDGRVWRGTQRGMHDELGLSKSLANRLVKGSIKSAKGWSLAGVSGGRKGGAQHPMYRSEVHEFVHVDGREFIGTQFEFHKTHGVSKPAASKLARRKVTVWNGWHLKGADLPKVGRASRWSAYRSGPVST